jgi:predicted dehydrogenase
MPSRRPLPVAIVGAGLMGRWHAHAATRAGGRVTVVVDPDAAAARALAARCPGAAPADRLGDAPADSGVAHICTPTATHAAVARQALEAGWHVLVEKPAADAPVDVDALLALAAARDRLVCPVHQFLYQDGVQHAMARLDAIGPLVHVGFTARSAGAEGGSAADRDRIALEILPHPLSLLTRVISDDLASIPWAACRPAPGELRLIAAASGIGLSVFVSMAGRPPVNLLAFVGARGTIEVDLFHGFAVIDIGPATRAGKIARPFGSGARQFSAAGANLARRAWRGEPAYPGLTRLVELFYRAVTEGGPSPIPTEETAAVARACAAIAARLASG